MLLQRKTFGTGKTEKQNKKEQMFVKEMDHDIIKEADNNWLGGRPLNSRKLDLERKRR